MCGIFGIFNSKGSMRNSILNIKKMLSLCNYRGRDNCRLVLGDYFEGIFDSKDYSKPSEILVEEVLSSFLIEKEKSSFILGHLLHSIVGFVKQPLNNKSDLFLSNCEIYNWQTLKKNYSLEGDNDAEIFFRLIERDGFEKALRLIDGDFAVAYIDLTTLTLYLARDKIGVKPLFYYFDGKKFVFASERKSLKLINSNEKYIFELNPKQILKYNLNFNQIEIIEREFYKVQKLKLNIFKKTDISERNSKIEMYKNFTLKEQILEQLNLLLFSSVRKRAISNQKVALLFSGGVDSTILGLILQRLKIDFICYTAVYKDGNVKEAKDWLYAKKIAYEHNFKLKPYFIDRTRLERSLPNVVSQIESRDYIKVSVALPIFFASELASKDGCKVIFSGLGSEEIFAGYRRHKKAKDVNLECLEGLKILHKRDLYRDDVITMFNNLELRLPFLDDELIKFCMSIPSDLKITDELVDKYILRVFGERFLGLKKEFAFRKKLGAQYGSKFDKGLLRLAKDKNLSKLDYLNSLDILVPKFEYN